MEKKNNNKSFLIIDDDEVVIFLVTRIIHQYNPDILVRSFINAKTALQTLQTEKANPNQKYILLYHRRNTL